MALTPNMGLPIDTPGTATGPGWATDLETMKLTIDAHTHVSGQGLQVPSAGINVNAAIPWNNNPATGVAYLGLQSQASLQSGVLGNVLQQQGGNLYWNNNANVPVQLTSGNTINVSAFGGITNLAGTTAALTYSAALQLFIATSNTNLSAGWDGADITVRPRNVASAQGVKIQAPTTLAASYTTTLPPALPAAATSGLLLIGPAPSGVQAIMPLVPPPATTSGVLLVGPLGQFTAANNLPSVNLFSANQFVAYRVGAFNIGGGNAQIAFTPDTVFIDAGGGYNAANGIYTIPSSGVWGFSWSAGGTPINDGESLSSQLIINSGIYTLGAMSNFAGGADGAQFLMQTAGSTIYPNALAGDKVRVNVVAGAARTLAMVVGSGNNHFSAFQIR